MGAVWAVLGFANFLRPARKSEAPYQSLAASFLGLRSIAQSLSSGALRA